MDFEHDDDDDDDEATFESIGFAPQPAHVNLSFAADFVADGRVPTGFIVVEEFTGSVTLSVEVRDFDKPVSEVVLEDGTLFDISAVDAFLDFGSEMSVGATGSITSIGGFC